MNAAGMNSAHVHQMTCDPQERGKRCVWSDFALAAKQGRLVAHSEVVSKDGINMDTEFMLTLLE